MELTDTTPPHGRVAICDLPLILLVEDSREDARLLQEALRERLIPVRVLHATSPSEAFSALRLLPPAGLPQLVVLDLQLPRQSGHDILKGLRTNPHWLDLPIVILTSSQRDTDRLLSFQHGAVAHLVKPTLYEEYLLLAERLVMYMRPRPLHPPAAPDTPLPA